MEQDLTPLWQQTLQEVQKQVSQGYFTLFKQTALLSLTDTEATIAAPSTMIIDMLQRRFSRTIIQALIITTKKEVTLSFVTKSVSSHASVKQDEHEMKPLFAQAKEAGPSAIGHPPRVRAEYVFTNFAVSGSNQLAHTAAMTVASNIGSSYNPFFIYGPVGVGKTHLMHAIANDVYHKDPAKKIIYTTSEEFTNEIVEAIKSNDTGRMKRRFRSAFLLIIDDIQFIEGKERVQEELFHTFNSLVDQGSQICFTSDRPPSEIKRIDDRLASRFESGLSVDIQQPDIELKTAILQIKAEKFGYPISTDIALVLAEHAEDNRKLEGLLLRVITQAKMLDEEITLNLVSQILGNHIQEQRSTLHAEDIIKSVCAFYNVKPTLLRGIKRDAGIVRARQVAMYLLKTELSLTFVEIGGLLGGRDHTTIMHGVDKIEKLVDNKAQISQDIIGITKSLRG